MNVRGEEEGLDLPICIFWNTVLKRCRKDASYVYRYTVCWGLTHLSIQQRALTGHVKVTSNNLSTHPHCCSGHNTSPSSLIITLQHFSHSVPERHRPSHIPGEGPEGGGQRATLIPR